MERTIEGLEYARGRVQTAKRMLAECETLRDTVVKLGRDAATQEAAHARVEWWRGEMLGWQEQVRLEQEQAPAPERFGPPLIGRDRQAVRWAQKCERAGETGRPLAIMRIVQREMARGMFVATAEEQSAAEEWIMDEEHRQRQAA